MEPDGVVAAEGGEWTKLASCDSGAHPHGDVARHAGQTQVQLHPSHGQGPLQGYGRSWYVFVWVMDDDVCGWMTCEW